MGFVRLHVKGVDRFLDSPGAKTRDAIQIIFAGEKVRAEYLFPTPDVTQSEWTGQFHVLKLQALVRMELTSFRIKDKMHILDLLDVGLVDEGWVNALPAEFRMRLQELIDNPDA
ncbi:hypothetical protein ACYOEI_00555 [Singulisphaera rosea]